MHSKHASFLYQGPMQGLVHNIERAVLLTQYENNSIHVTSVQTLVSFVFQTASSVLGYHIMLCF